MSYNLTDTEKKVKEFLDTDPNKEYNIKEIALNTGYNVRYLRNLLQKNETLLKNNLIIKIKKGNLSFFRGIEKKFLSTIEFIENFVKSEELKQIFLDIISNKYPLGIHYLQCHKKDPNLRTFYRNSKWKIQQGNKAKIYDLKGVEKYGRTRILIFEGKSKGKVPTIQIIYSGTVGKEKHYLTEKTYPIWYEIVESNIKNLLNVKYGLDSFDITQMEFNLDFDLKKDSFYILNRIKNVKMRTLTDIIEIYTYESAGGIPKGRIGKRITDVKQKMSKGLMLQKGLADFLSYNQKTVDAMNYVVDQGKDLNTIQKQIKTLINQQARYTDIAKKTIETYPPIIDDLTTKVNNLNTSFSKDFKNMKTEVTHITSELDLSRKDFKTLKDSIGLDIKNIESKIKKEKKDKRKLISIMEILSKNVKDNSKTNRNLVKLSEQISDSSDLNYQQSLDTIKTVNKRIDKMDDLFENIAHRKYRRNYFKLIRKKDKEIKAKKEKVKNP